MQRNEEDKQWSLDGLRTMLETLDRLCEREFPNALSSETVKKILDAIPQLKEIAEDRDDIKALFEENINNPYHETTIHKMNLLDIILDSWFEREACKLMLDTNFKKPPHDIREDFLNYTYNLALEMAKQHIDHVRPENATIYGRFFRSNDPKTVYCRNACPLVKNGDVYRFVTRDLGNYFIARVSDYESMNTFLHRPL